MRYINIDLSSDNHLQQPQIFGGYAGEHNETVLQVKLPQRMIGVEYSDYRFDFQTSEDNEILIPVSKLDNGILSCHLTEQLTVAGKLLFNVIARKLDGHIVSLTSKTNMVNLYIGDSPDGNNVLPNPTGYKDEILKLIDAQIAEAVADKMDKFGELTPGSVALNDNIAAFDTIHDVFAFVNKNTGAPTCLAVATPTEDIHAATKQYVDNITGNISTALDELHAYAQALVTGGATK